MSRGERCLLNTFATFSNRMFTLAPLPTESSSTGCLPVARGSSEGKFHPAAQKQTGSNHKVALCCSNSLLSFPRATATNRDVFSRSIPFWYSVFEYHSPQKSRTIRALCSQ